MTDAHATVRIWDLPTRLFHWALAACVLGSVVSAKIGGAAMVWHLRCGYTVLALLAFRLLWGLVGGRWSRFGSFLFGPRALWRYLQRRPADGERLDVGHSPLGALSVFALLGLLAAQVATGLVADDEIATVGPLNRYVDTATGLAATGWHKAWGQWLILAMVGLHLAAVAWYVARGSDILAAMLGGDKSLPPGTPASADGARQRWQALMLALACAAVVTGVVSLGG
ncbi:MAG: cytochrome b/b6 domain-containing protein [Rubrivivax sp.]|nr:cytochrome b/b6 domain-containing protein [Rubrivivax sp.]